MTRSEAMAALESLNRAVAAAVALIRSEEKTIHAFREETARMAGLGPILDPTLFNSSERRAIEAVVLPIYSEALNLLTIYDHQMAKAKAGLRQVSA